MKAARITFLVIMLVASVSLNVVWFVRNALQHSRIDPHPVGHRAPSSTALLSLPRTNDARLAYDSVRECSQSMNELRAQRDELKRKLQRHTMPNELFAHSPDTPNAELAEELRHHLSYAEQGDISAADIECRGWVCRVQRSQDAASGPELDREWARHNIRNSVQSRKEVYYGWKALEHTHRQLHRRCTTRRDRQD